jgi:TetR/AcrR family transcriptional repressor of nem operon
LSGDHLEDVDGSCPLIGLSSNVARSGQVVKAAYREVAEKMILIFETGLKGPGAREQALVHVALCVGGMVLARAIDDQGLADDFCKAANKHILKISGWRDGRGM